MNHITLQSEYIATFFRLPITNTFLTTIIVTILLAIVALDYSYNQNKKNNFILESLEVIVYQILKIIDGFTKNRTLSKQVLPLITTFFLFIFTANILALVPGFLGSIYVMHAHEKIALLRSPNSDLTTTLALALVSLFATQIFSIKTNGWEVHIQKFINFKSPLTIFIGFIALISEGAKILSFSFRLFGSIFAGEVLLLITSFLVPYFVPIPFMILELFIGMIQSYIFALLTLSFIEGNVSQA